MTLKDFIPWFIIALILFMIAICIIAETATASENNDYYIQGHAIYYDGIFHLDHNTTVKLDTINRSTDFNQLVKNETENPKPKLLQSQSFNYADALITPSANLSIYKPYDPVNATRIHQGDYVYLGETIDFAGVGWYTGVIVYGGPYETGYNLADSPNSTKIWRTVNAMNLSAYYMDPEYYSDKLGWWYSGYNEASPRGNDRLFYVGAYPKNETYIEALNKKADLDKAAIEAAIIKNLTEIPERSDPNGGLILSRNVSTVLESPYKDFRYWIFANGLKDQSLYDITPEYPGIVEFKNIMTANLPENVYEILFIQPDPIGQFEQTYDLEKHSISSPFRGTPDVVIYGRDSIAIEGILENQIKSSQQKNFTRWIINLQDPQVDIRRLDTWTFGNNNTRFTLNGYTNMNPGDTLTIMMDAKLKGDKWYGAREWTAQVVDHGGMNCYRTWNVTFNVDYSNMFPGPHDITVVSNEGASATVPFYVHRELAGHHQDPEYIQYVGNSPFIPPVYINTTVIKEVPGPVQTVIVHDTPAPAVVQAAADKAANETAETYAGAALIIVGLYLAGRWILDAYRRSK